MKIEALNGAADILEIAVEDGALYSKLASDDENILYQEMLEEIAVSLRRRATKMQLRQLAARENEP